MIRMHKSTVSLVLIILISLVIAIASVSFADETDLNKQGNELRAIASLVERGIYSGDQTGGIAPERDITVAEFVTSLVKFYDYTVIDIESENWFEPYYRAAVVQQILEKNEYSDHSKVMTNAEAIQFIYRAKGALPSKKIDYAHLSKTLTWGEAALYLYNEMEYVDSSNSTSGIFTYDKLEEDGYWSDSDFNKYLSEAFKNEYSECVEGFKIINKDWTFIDGYKEIFLNRFEFENAEFIDRTIYEIMRKLVWTARENDAYIIVKNEDEAVTVIEYYTDKDIRTRENPAFWIKFVPKEKGERVKLRKPTIEIYASTLYDQERKMQNTDMTKFDYLRYIRDIEYKEDLYVNLIESVLQTIHGEKIEEVENHFLKTYSEVKSGSEDRVLTVNTMNQDVYYDWSFMQNGKSVYGFSIKLETVK